MHNSLVPQLFSKLILVLSIATFPVFNAKAQNDQALASTANKSDGAQGRREQAVKLDQAVFVGGMVQDPEGKPIRKATVEVYGIVRDEAGQSLEIPYDTGTTDPAGQWSSAVPANFQWLTFKLSHLEFLPAEFDLAPDDTSSTGNLTRANLLNRTSVLRMQPGIRVEGIVTDRQAQPIEGADVILALDSDPPKKQNRMTEKTGAFRFLILEVGDYFLVIQGKGVAPQWKAVRVEPGLKPFQFVLAPGNNLKGRVTDATGKPVEGSTVAVESWHGHTLLGWHTWTDADGRFIWDSAPVDAVKYTVSQDGYNTITGLEIVAKGGETGIRLEQAFLLTGKVVDAETRQPIPQFSLIRGRVYGASDDPPRWERYSETRGSGGQYSIQESSERGSRIRYLVEAPGYLPVVSPEFSYAGWHTNAFELKKGSGPKGVVQLASGEPVEGAEVALMGADYIALSKAKFGARNSGMEKFIAKTDPMGRFSLPPATSRLIVAVHEKGYGETTADELVKSGRLILQPWGTIEGILRVGNKPGTNLLVMVTTQPIGPNPLSYDRDTFGTTTDAQGRFFFSNVPPGPRTLARLIPFGQRIQAPSHLMSVEVKPGEVTRVTYGGDGRPVIGKAAVSDLHKKVDWRLDYHSLRSLEVVRAGQNSKDVKKTQPDQRRYCVQFSDDGSFRIDDVAAGVYELRLNLTDPDDPLHARGAVGRSIGTLTKEIVVPEMPNGRSDEPLDLGTLTITVK